MLSTAPRSIHAPARAQAFILWFDEVSINNTDVAVRSSLDDAQASSATAEDLPDASFAGQQETYLNVHGVKQVLEACHKCFASIFADYLR